MKQSNPMKILSVAVASVLIGGCVSNPEQRDQMAGAAVGCVGGALIGAMLGDRNAALAGCAAGALAGWGTVKMSQYYAKQTRSRAADEAYYRSSDPEFYGLAKTSTQSVAKIREATSAPEKIKAGETVTSSTTYSVRTPKGANNASVAETYRLMKDGKILVQDAPKLQVRQGGEWTATAVFPIPTSAKPGTYVVEHEVTVGTTKDTRRSIFIVG
uniref:Glycine zipper n=1 Tax=Candidatus Kentrum sp. TC TaxID=2126339 RepID=A0A450Y947_9GAMM|nr:MAG: hypothetical protein BECKTC1821D_GA0114238_100339 [Candidatus Kentron sp. TC]VFK38980.1 MAG: hypothetical protein BECKTC1821E_GA0114239_100366 [Candidatus Kentron sp. TC]VFK54610.1 MAG: hypothetical protein BECKTC1821F_GA0114240_100564 [Candidatus Kentron sp. TC]